jgi:cyclopropane fatty-acyl-phospholipid synthase-like methyltransferase
MSPSVPPAYFDALYARDPDPWSFETSAYEARKYEMSLAALPSQPFQAALELGCSIGVLTRMLALRCEALLATDGSAVALEHARRRCADLPRVRFRKLRIPDEWPEGDFDLIVLSEILYFLEPSDIRRSAARVRESLRTRGAVLVVNYLGEMDNPTTGEQAAEIFLAGCAPRLRPASQLREPGWRLDLLAGGE